MLAKPLKLTASIALLLIPTLGCQPLVKTPSQKRSATDAVEASGNSASLSKLLHEAKETDHSSKEGQPSQPGIETGNEPPTSGHSARPLIAVDSSSTQPTLEGQKQPSAQAFEQKNTLSPSVNLQLSDSGLSVPLPSENAPSHVQQTSSTEESLLSSAAKRTVDLVRSAIPLPAELERNRLGEEIAAFEKFDFSFDLPTIAGERVSSKSFGGQLFVIDIWATWCGPCKRGIPELIELQKEYESHGIQVIGITCDSLDGEDSQEVARRAYNISEQMKVNYPLLVDDGSTIPQIPGFRSYPTTLFMTPDGRVRYMVSGLQSKAKLEVMIKTLLEL